MFRERILISLFILSIQIIGVCAEELNIASEGTPSQTSEWNGGQYPAANAIDNDISTFSHTDSDTNNNSWLLAFDSERSIQRIEIIARTDCCAGRLTDTVLRLLDDDGESVFDSIVVDPGAGQSATFELPVGTFGKSVRIGFEESGTNPEGNRNLHLGEVRVFSDFAESVLVDSFLSSASQITGGDSVTLSWATTGAVHVEIPGHGVFAPSGSTTLALTQSAELTLLATGESGTTVTSQISVIVDGALLPLIISEFMAAPTSAGIFAGDDWIEIHNPNPGSAPLGGYRLSDLANHSTTWTIPDGTAISPNGFLLIRASGTEVGTDPLEAPFRLAREEGSYLALLNPDGSVSSEFVYPEQREGITFGYDIHGTLGYFTQPTPGATNGNSSIEGFVADTRFSHDRGFYSEPFELEITSATEGAKILITLDGSRPELENSSTFTYEGPLNISRTTVVRAAAFRDGHLPTNIDTQSYFFTSDILLQSDKPEGFPLDWGNGPGVQRSLPARSDYGMDPRIVEDAPFTDLNGDAFDWDDALKSIPSVSLVLPILDLLDPDDGLHARARNRGRAWEREASMEIIDPIRGISVQANCGLRMQGGWNRFPEMLKKSMRLYFRSDYGDGKLHYPLFEDSEIAEFDRLVLRSGNGKAWPSPWRALSGSGNSLPRTTYLRDQFVRDTQKDLGHPTAHGSFVHLYVNGLYWGLYNPVERIDEKFASAHFGGEESDYEIVKWIRGLGGLQLVSGSTDAWAEMRRRARLPMSDTANYQTVLELLDPVNLIDYMIANMYAGNIDWQDNNGYAIRNGNLDAGGDGKWRFFSWDGEETFLSINQDSTRQNVSNTATEIYSRLRGNEDFRMLFADRLYRAFFNDGALTVESADARWMCLAGWIDHAIVGESARWGDLMRKSNPYDRDDWEREIFNIRENYIGSGKTRHRTEITLRQFASLGLYPDLDPPLVVPSRGGIVDQGQVVRLEHPDDQDATIYFTVDGTDPRDSGGTLSASAQVSAGGSISQTVVRASTDTMPGSIWKYLDTGVDLGGSGWTRQEFDDSAWPSGPSELGYGDRNERTVVGYGSEAGAKFITTYFRHTFDLITTGASSPDKVTRLSARILFDDGVVVYLNGTEIARFFLPDGEVDAQTLALSGGDEKKYLDIRSIDTSLLVVGANTLSVEVHQVKATNSDISLDLELTADYVPEDLPEGIVVNEPFKLNARAFDGENWSALQEVEFTFPAAADDALVISEVYYAPGNGHAPGAEFVELVNQGDAPIDLDGLTFTQGIAFSFQARTLAAGERVSIVRDLDAFLSAFPDVVPERVAGTFANGTALNNGGERIELSSADGTVISSVSYETQFPWPDVSSEGYSLTLISGTNPQLPENWRASVARGGSPGSSDAAPPPAPGENLLEYYFASAPAVEVNDQSLSLIVSTIPGTDAVTFVVEHSSNLNDWKVHPSVERIACRRLAPDRVENVYSLGNAAESEQYLRLRIFRR